MATKLIESATYAPEVCEASLDCEGKCRTVTPHKYTGHWLKGQKLVTKYVEHWFKCQKCGHGRIWGTYWLTNEQLAEITGET